MKKQKFALSPLALNNQKPSFINKMTASFTEDFREGLDINLGIGYVNDQTMPTQEIAAAYSYVINHPEKYRNALNYGSAEGSPNLRQSIKNFYHTQKIGHLTKEDLSEHTVTIGVNGATSLLDAFSDVLAPGLVITGDPFYYSYTENLTKKGFHVKAIPSDHQGIIPEEIEKSLNKNDIKALSFFYIITVNNPDSVILSDQRRKEIVALAEHFSEKIGHLIPVIFDRAYEDIIHDPEVSQPISALKYNRLGNIFEIGTFSKLFAPALRIGFMMSKNNEIRRQIIQRISDIGFSNSLINQEITSRLIDHDLDQHRNRVLAGYRQKAVNIKAMLEKELSEYTEDIRGGQGGFYFYITFKNVKTNEGSHFFKFLSRSTGHSEVDGYPALNPRLIYVPGTVCSQQDKSVYQLRLSYGFENSKVFSKAIALMREACHYATLQNSN